MSGCDGLGLSDSGLSVQGVGIEFLSAVRDLGGLGFQAFCLFWQLRRHSDFALPKP